jgi:hypothetical protein
MWHDSIVEEVRCNRQVYAARFHHDIKVICRAAREQQKNKRSQSRFVVTTSCHNSHENR